MKQTAVEFLEQEIFRRYKFTFQQLNCQPLEEAIQQAKEMEKQQIIDCGNTCALMQYIHVDRVNQMSIEEVEKLAEEDNITFGEQYYDETFKSEQDNE